MTHISFILPICIILPTKLFKNERKLKMEVIIFSRSGERIAAVTQAADNIIAEKRLRLMSIHTSKPQNAEELAKNIKPSKGHLIIMDTISCPDWKETASQISEKFHCVSFCLVSDNNKAAAEAVNSRINVCGYVNINNYNLSDGLEKALVQIHKRIATVCGGIMTTDKSGALKVIDFNDIYYIETIKQQHRCTVYHKNGSDVIRADISKLIKSLDGRFEITRSSTIANLSLTDKISDGMLFFKDGSYCSVAAKKVGEIKKAMQETAII